MSIGLGLSAMFVLLHKHRNRRFPDEGNRLFRRLCGSTNIARQTVSARADKRTVNYRERLPAKVPRHERGDGEPVVIISLNVAAALL